MVCGRTEVGEQVRRLGYGQRVAREAMTHCGPAKYSRSPRLAAKTSSTSRAIATICGRIAPDEKKGIACI